VLEASKGIEVGNIFDLGDRFTQSFGVVVQGPDGAKQEVFMGCYGIGITRLVGAIVEASHDEKGMIWPKAVAPFPVHMVMIGAKDPAVADRVRAAAAELERALTAIGCEPLFDDREDARAGEKFADADLIGLPVRLVISEKTLAESSVEWKDRKTGEQKMVPLAQAVEEVKKHLAA
jgi:prolyl-tRNA synthetase